MFNTNHVLARVCIMELGESFFDDDDVVVEDKKSISLPQYAPKYCEPEVHV